MGSYVLTPCAAWAAVERPTAVNAQLWFYSAVSQAPVTASAFSSRVWRSKFCMDTTLITDLPRAAYLVLAGHLSRADAASCRIASRQLAGVKAEPSGSRLWVVAGTFTSQIQQDLQNAVLKRDAAAQGPQHLGSAPDQPSTSSTQPVYDSLLTATSLRRAAEGAFSAHVLIDISRPSDPGILQALFRALLSSSTLHDLVVTEYVSANSDDALRRLRVLALDSGAAADLACLDGENRSHHTTSSSEFSCQDTTMGKHWLSALIQAWKQKALLLLEHESASVEHHHQQQQQDQQQEMRSAAPCRNLKLQNMAPLPHQQAVQVAELKDLGGLEVQSTPVWQQAALYGRIGDFGSVLPVPLLAGLRGMPQLTRLAGTVPGSYVGLIPSKGATMLQQLLHDLGTRLTRLSLGTKYGYYSLSAPLRGMPALRSLTCNLGFSLDTDTDLEDVSMQQIQQAEGPAAEAGTPSALSAAVIPPLLPNLTRLVLEDPASVPDVLERLAASEAVCRQLQYLEIPRLDYQEDDDAPDWNEFADQQQQLRDPALSTLQLLGKLTGLQELQAVVCGKQQLDTLVAAVGSTLQSLTITCWEGHLRYSLGYAPSMVQVRSVLVGMPQLTSLKVVGGSGYILDPQDLAKAAKHLSTLKSLSYTGQMFALPDMPFELQRGMLPATLQDLTIVARLHEDLGDTDGRYILHPGALPSGLTSLKLRGVLWEEEDQQATGTEPWHPLRDLSLLPSGLRALELDMVEIKPQSVSAAVVAPAEAGAAAGMQTLQGLPGDEYAAALPNLTSLALHFPGPARGSERLARFAAQSLGEVLDSLSACGLTGLTTLHISGRVSYTAGDSLQSLSTLQHLKVLTLKPALSGGNSGGHVDLCQVLMCELGTNLQGATGLRVLRLPGLNPGTGTEILPRLADQLPNCLLVMANDTVTDDTVVDSSSFAAS